MSGNTFFPLLTCTVVIDSNLSGKEYYFVTLDTSDADRVVNLAAAASAPVFILGEGADGSTTEAIGTLMVAGFGKLKLGGSVSRGDRLTSDGNGKGIATTTNNDWYGAIAMEAGVSNDVIEVLIAVGQVGA